MKKPLVFAFSLFLFFTASVFAFAAEEPINLIAHRGYSAVAPENTLAAVKEAGKAGFSACEFDIRTTADHVWVVMHNSTVDQMTNGTGEIGALTFSELRKLHIDSGNGIDTYKNEKVPTLEEMLDECKKYNLPPVIEIKSGSDDDLAALCAILESRAEKQRFTVISFESELLIPIKRTIPEAKCLVLFDEIPDGAIQYCIENNLNGIDFRYNEKNLSVAQAVKNAGLEVCSYTIDAPEDLTALYYNGVTNITTNRLTKKAVRDVIPGAVFIGGYQTENTCSCNCHKTGFMGFFWKIVNFFNRIFGINKICSCGAVHY